MAELLLQRRYCRPTYTIGRLSVNGLSYCDVLEDPVRDYNKDGDLLDEGEEKIYGDTAIPYGRYRVVVTYSPKFKRKLPLLLDVKHFDGIRMHSGKTTLHTHGCQILGDNKIKGQVQDGMKYVDDLTAKIEAWDDAGEETYITIV